jgi:parallel beta-helix repeat protein
MGPADNMVFVGNSFSTEDQNESWTPEDWVNKPFITAFASNGTCTGLVENHFFNVRDAVSIGGDRTLAQGNLIERMGNDGIDIVASDLIIRGNVIRDGRHTPKEPLHPDGIQGWTAPGVTNRNVLIEGNEVINVNPSDDNALQGIDIFDGHWDGVTVVNNVVITNHSHGIALYGVDNAKVINNTVVPARPEKMPSWITIHDNKDKTPSHHVIVRNNIAAQFIVDGEDITFDHNIAQKRISVHAHNSAFDREDLTADIARGSVGDHNVVNGAVFAHFADYEPGHDHFDLRPNIASPAREAGAEDGAPPVDISGQKREAPYDIGAFAR